MATLRSRIVFTLIGALLIAGCVTVWATYDATRSEFAAVFDEQLKETALELVEKGDVSLENMTLLGQASSHRRIQVQIYDASTNTLSRSLRGEPLPIAETTGFLDVVSDGGTLWREYVSTVGTKIYQVAQPMQIRRDLAISAAMRILQPILILFPFLCIAIWFVIVEALQPLNRTARAVAKRSPASLEPLSTENLPNELEHLVSALNNLLARLGTSLTAQQRFASDAAHELRTPLAAIKLQAQLISRARTDEIRTKHLGRLQQAVARATRLVEQLLTIARLDPDASSKPLAEVALADLAHGVVEDLSAPAAAKNISLSADTVPLSVMGMSDALRLMVTNLTDNAIRYTPEGGRIVIGVERAGASAKITVTDDGPGIAPSERERVFERFYRALGTKVSGTGLGLAIVSRIVQIHQGTIRIQEGFTRQDESGYGARFVITIPITPTVTTAAASAA